MEHDAEVLLDATTGLIPPLLDALEALSWAGRHLHPPDIDGLVNDLAPFRVPLTDGLERFEATLWPSHLAFFEQQARAAAGHALRALTALEEAPARSNPVLGAYGALRHLPLALEALYPVSFMLGPVSRFYVSRGHRSDADLLERLARADPGRDEVGVMHASNGSDERGGFSVYVPEYYESGQAMPLVVALHGGSGHGRNFLWTWLTDARTRGVILVTPTSRDDSWSLQGPDLDTANLQAIVEHVSALWSVDESRILLTGMSDGATFSWVSGLQSGSPFTHLAPVSGTFHPLLLEVADPARLRGLPVYLVHGALDWMFPVEVAREARDTLMATGAQVTFREIPDLSHTYPREENDGILSWLETGA